MRDLTARVCSPQWTTAIVLIIINTMARTSRDPEELKFGERLGELLVQGRESSSKSVRQVASSIGTSPHGLYAVESGKVLSPGFRTVYLLAREYGLDLTELARSAEAGTS